MLDSWIGADGRGTAGTVFLNSIDILTDIAYTHSVRSKGRKMHRIGKLRIMPIAAVRDAEEARAYLAHDLLGPRLIDTTHLVLSHRGTDPVAMLGETDAYKLRACATLFEAASPTTPVFAALIDGMFGGQRCTKTLRILRTPPADDLFA